MLPISPKKQNIFILEDDAYFRPVLMNVCSRYGDAKAADNIKDAIHELTSRAYDFLLIDWHLIHNQQWAFGLFAEIEHIQPTSQRMALFSALDLSNVLTALKSGFQDVLCVAWEPSVLEQKIKEFLAGTPSRESSVDNFGSVSYSTIERSYYQNTNLNQAKRIFTRTFLEQLLGPNKLQKRKIATFMDVSPKTLERYLRSEDLS